MLSLVFAVMVMILNMQQQKILVNELGKKGENLAKFLSGISAEPILSYNYGYLENYVRDISAGDATIVYAVVQDKSGNPITHQMTEPADKKNIMEFSSPVLQNSETIGKIKIGFTTANINSALQKSRADYLWPLLSAR